MDTLRMAFERGYISLIDFCDCIFLIFWTASLINFPDGENADISANVYDNINVVAGILKQYFRLLPIPLLTYEVHPVLIKAVRKYL